MITSGLVITLAADAELARSAEAELRTRPELTLGELRARWLPAAMEAADVRASRDLHDWLNSVPGVDHVDVVAVNFVEEDSISEQHEFAALSIRGATESSPQRELWERGEKPQVPEGRKKIRLAAESVAPTGLGSSLPLTHGSRRGLLFAAAPQLTQGSPDSRGSHDLAVSEGLPGLFPASNSSPRGDL